MTDIVLPTLGLMVDIETLDLGARPLITQIGLVPWDMEEDTILSDGLHTFLPMQPQLELIPQRTISADTFTWWMKQSDEARAVFDKNISDDFDDLPLLLRQFVRRVAQLTNNGKIAYEIWARGPQFDLVAIETLLKDCGFATPWKYDRIRDLRTLMALAGVKSEDVSQPQGFVAHNAFWDCKFQIECYREAKRRLRSL